MGVATARETWNLWPSTCRHNGAANYLYLDGHASTLNWAAAVIDMYPDKKVLTQNSSFP